MGGGRHAFLQPVRKQARQDAEEHDQAEHRRVARLHITPGFTRRHTGFDAVVIARRDQVVVGHRELRHGRVMHVALSVQPMGAHLQDQLRISASTPVAG